MVMVNESGTQRCYVFAHDGEPRGGAHDYIASLSTPAVARHHVERLDPVWAQVTRIYLGRVVILGEYQDGRWLRWEPEKRLEEGS